MLEILSHWNVGAVLYVLIIVGATIGALRAMRWSNGVNRRYIDLHWSPWFFFAIIWAGFSFSVLGWAVLTNAHILISHRDFDGEIAALDKRLDTIQEKCDVK